MVIYWIHCSAFRKQVTAKPKHRRGKNPKPLIEIDIVRSVISIETSNYEIGLAKLEQLEALMAAASGPGYQPFSALNKRLQENLVMLAADLAQEARRSLAQPTA